MIAMNLNGLRRASYQTSTSSSPIAPGQTPNPRFQGIAEIKYSNTTTYVGQTSHAQDEQLLALLEKTIQQKPSSKTFAFLEVDYCLANNNLLSMRHLENGVEVFIDSPTINQALTQIQSISRPYLYLTFDTVAADLHDRLKALQQTIGQMFRLAPQSLDHNKNILAAVDQTIHDLQ